MGVGGLGHYGLDYDEERVRLQKWVEAEGTQAVPMGHDGDLDTGDLLPRHPELIVRRSDVRYPPGGYL